MQILMLIGGDGPPSVRAGDDTNAVSGTSVEIRGDVGGSAYQNRWEQISGPVVDISDPNSTVLRFNAPVVAEGTVLSFRLSADDGSGGILQDDVEVTIHPNAAPELSVAFPCGSCRAYGGHLTLRGKATPGSDVEFVASRDAVSVRVNLGGGEVAAIMDEQGGWQVIDVPLPTETNSVEIIVTAEDAFGASTDEVLDLALAPTLITPIFVAHPIENKFIFLETLLLERLLVYDVASDVFSVAYENFGPAALSQVLDIDIDPDGSRAVVGEVHTGRIVGLNLTTGALNTISNVNVGSGPALQSARELSVDSDDGRLVVFDDQQDSLFLVDLNSGDRTEVASVIDTPVLALNSAANVAYVTTSGEGNSGPVSSSLIEIDLSSGVTKDLGAISVLLPTDMAYDSGNDQLGLLRAGTIRVYSVDPADAGTTVLSDHDPAGITFNYPAGIQKDPLAERFLINDFRNSTVADDNNAILAVDASTGVRETVFKDSVGSGPTITGRALLKVRTNGSELFALSQTTGYLYLVSLHSSSRTLISGNLLGVGPALQSPRDIELVNDGIVLVVDSTLQALVKVNVSTGDRTVVSSAAVGSGTEFDLPVALALNQTADTAFVLDESLGVVFSVDLATGDRTILSAADQSGISLLEVTAMVHDADQGRLVVTDRGPGGTSGNQVVGLDVVTGDRHIISSFDRGTGPLLNDPDDVFVWSESQTAIVATGGSVLHLDLATGNRSLLADSITGNGDVVFLDSLTGSTGSDVVYGWNTMLQSVTAIDARTGDRVVVSK